MSKNDTNQFPEKQHNPLNEKKVSYYILIFRPEIWENDPKIKRRKSKSAS